jgi:hypothetical protein
LTIVLHSSRARHDASKANYKATSAVALSELGKLLVSLGLALREVLDSGDVPLKPLDDGSGLGIDLEQEKRALFQPSPETTPARNASTHHKARRRHHSSQFSIAMDELSTPEMQKLPSNPSNLNHASHGQSSSVDLDPAAWFSPKTTMSPRDEFPSFSSPEKVPFSVQASPDRSGIPLEEFIQKREEMTPVRSPLMEDLDWTWRDLLEATRRQVFTAEALKLAIPAVMFTFQSTLQHVAVANLSVPAFQVTAQLKVGHGSLCCFGF